MLLSPVRPVELLPDNGLMSTLMSLWALMHGTFLPYGLSHWVLAEPTISGQVTLSLYFNAPFPNSLQKATLTDNRFSSLADSPRRARTTLGQEPA